MRTLITALLAALVACAAPASPAWAQGGPRLALVIANQDYPPGVGRLSSPSASADAIERALEDARFTVMRFDDLDRRALNRRVREFADALERAGPEAVGFFYYAGHGASAPVIGAGAGEQLWENFLAPADTPIANVDDLRDEGVSLDVVVARLEEGAGASALFVVVDACRDLAFATGGMSIRQRGFAPAAARASTLVAYSTPNGETAPDSDDYARALAAAIAAPNRSAFDAFRAAHRAVADLRDTHQQPLLRGDPGDDFCFVSCPAGPDAIAWALAERADTLEAYESFLAIYPDSARADAARSRIAALRGVEPTPRGPAEDVAEDFADLGPDVVEAVRSGDAARIYALGREFASGANGRVENDHTAARLFRAACEAGAAGACADLGVFVEQGAPGITPNEAEAVGLYRQACDGGAASGCTGLGFMYERGVGGLSVDDDEAIALYRRALALDPNDQLAGLLLGWLERRQ